MLGAECDGLQKLASRGSIKVASGPVHAGLSGKVDDEGSFSVDHACVSVTGVSHKSLEGNPESYRMTLAAEHSFREFSASYYQFVNTRSAVSTGIMQ